MFLNLGEGVIVTLQIKQLGKGKSLILVNNRTKAGGMQDVILMPF